MNFKPLTVGSLFSGIGGIDMGLENAGFVIKWMCEADSYCQKILRQYFGNTTLHSNVMDLTDPEPVDMICGGFPCQPVSIAGKQKGTEDERWLWDEMLRVCDLVRPGYVLAENVPGLLSADAGRIFGGVVRDLASIGYFVEWEIIPASALGAPHQRYRVFILAHRHGWRQQTCPKCDSKQEPGQPVSSGQCRDHPYRLHNDVPNPNGEPKAERGEHETHSEEGSLWSNDSRGGSSNAPQRPIRSTRKDPSIPYPILSGLQGNERFVMALEDARRSNTDPARSGWWAAEPELGRVADGVPNWVHRIRVLGNAVVPHVAEWLGEQIYYHYKETLWRNSSL